MNGPPGPAVTNVTAAVQRDWENRELVEALRLQVKALATFVSDFDSVSRGKLAALNDRLTRMERTVERAEAMLQSIASAKAQQKAAAAAAAAAQQHR